MLPVGSWTQQPIGRLTGGYPFLTCIEDCLGGHRSAINFMSLHARAWADMDPWGKFGYVENWAELGVVKPKEVVHPHFQSAEVEPHKLSRHLLGLDTDARSAVVRSVYTTVLSGLWEPYDPLLNLRRTR